MVYNVVNNYYYNNVPNNVPQPVQEGEKQYPSMFRGGALSRFFRSMLVLLVSLFTLFLAYPAMKCWFVRWEVNHTYINSRQLYFDGKASQLYGSYIKWFLLSIVTIGIYLIFFMPLNMQRWVTKHTHFKGVNGESNFNGSVLGLWGVKFVSRLVTIITIGIASFWATCYRQRWMERHKVIDGHALYFDGHGIQLFGKTILWLFLSIITIGIFLIWRANSLKKWNTSHTYVQMPHALPVRPLSQEEFKRLNALENNKICGLAIASLVLFVCMPVYAGLIILGVLQAVNSNGGSFVLLIIALIISSVCFMLVPILSGVALAKAKKAEKTEKNIKYKKLARAVLIVWCTLLGLSMVASIAGAIITNIQYQNSLRQITYELNDDGQSYKVVDVVYSGEVEIPSTYNGLPVTSIGDNAFASCIELTSITLPSSITSIGDNAFFNCSSLSTLTLPDGITSIGDSAFFDCYALTSVTLPSSITSIGEYAFSYCSSLTSITIPNTVTSIGMGAFNGCEKLASVTFGQDSMLKEIDDYAFNYCSALVNFYIPVSVTTIGSSFEYCDNLTTIILPASVKNLTYFTFHSCNLSTVYYTGDRSQWIESGISNDTIQYATVYYYSETEPITTGNYWHYDDNGKPVAWENISSETLAFALPNYELYANCL